MEAFAEFTPHLASAAMIIPFEQRGGGFCGSRQGPTPASTVVVLAYGGGR